MDSRSFAGRERGGRAVGVLAVLLAVLGLPAAAGAGPGGARDFTDLSLEELMAIPVYAASGYRQATTEAPSRVSVVTREEIRAFGYRTLAEAIAGQAGFFSSYDRQYRYLGIRGFSPPGDYNTRVLVLLNGQRVNEELYSSPGIGTDALVDIGLVDRIEIVRGPGSSLYGSSAFLAVVNVITRPGRDLDGAEVEGFAASHETFAGRLSYGRAFGEDVEVLVSGTLEGSAGPDLYFEAFDAPGTNHGRVDGLDGETGGSLFLDAHWGAFRFHAAYKRRVKEVPTAPWETIFDEPGQKIDEQWLQAGLSWQRDFAGAGRLSTLLTYQDYASAGDYPYDFARRRDPAPVVVFNRDFGDASVVGVEGRFVTEELARNRIHAGLEYRDLFRLDQSNFWDGAEEPVQDSREDGAAWGAYLQDEVRLADWAALSAGLRFDRLDPGGRENLSPRIGLILKPGPATAVKLLYGEAFRAPNAYELYFDDGGETQKANPALGSESIRSYEAVLEHRIGESVQANLSVYHWVIDGLIRQAVDPGDGLLVFENLERAAADGVEVEISADLPRGASATAVYAYTEAEDRMTGERLVNSPRHVAALRLGVPLVPGRVNAGAEARYLGERRTVSGASVGGAFLANLTLGVQGRGGRWEARAGAYNLLDAGYADPVGSEHAQDSVEQDGRTFRATVTMRF